MAAPSCNIVVAADSAALSRAAVEHVAAASAAAIAARGKFVVALSGGSMPALLAPLVYARQ
jgi:6-phosphogluconolactonase